LEPDVAESDKFFLSKLDQRWGSLFAAIEAYLPRSNDDRDARN
jgi:hypothetical protein